MSTVERIKDRLPITDVVGSYIKLVRAGRNLKARCPFHEERTPSFFISPDRGTYYCFGCGAKGDIFTFIEKFEGVDFLGALKLLAERSGVRIEWERGGEREARQRLYKIIDEATCHYEKNLNQAKEVTKYLNERGLNRETIEHFRLGFAESSWDCLWRHLEGKGFSPPELLEAGLIRRREGGEGTREYYDYFRGRVMFPLTDAAGRVVGFSGRIFGTVEGAKYINSPDTVLFRKSRVLYGLDRAKGEIRRQNFALLVEGQMDLLACHQAGLGNAVAISGSSLTSEHLDILKHFSPNLLFALDSDEAGKAAALRSGRLALEEGMTVKIARLPPDSDPADMILKNPADFTEALRSAKHIIDFHWENVNKAPYDRRRLWATIGSEVLPYVAMLRSRIEQSHFLKVISENSGIEEASLWEELYKLERSSVPEPSVEMKDIAPPLISRRDTIARRLTSIFHFLSQRSKGEGRLSLIETKLKETLGEEGSMRLLSPEDSERETLLFEAEALYGDGEAAVLDIEPLILDLEAEGLKARLAQMTEALKEAEDLEDVSRAEAILKDCQTLSAKLSDIVKDRRNF